MEYLRFWEWVAISIDILVLGIVVLTMIKQFQLAKTRKLEFDRVYKSLEYVTERLLINQAEITHLRLALLDHNIIIEPVM